jgi:hypothetical protein
MSQNHFTVSFPLKSAADAKALEDLLPPMMPAFYQAADTQGTMHYSRFTVLNDNSLLFLVDFDGDFGPLMTDLAKLAGPVFDTILQHVDSPPPTPVAKNADAFVEWSADHLLKPATLFSAYPELTVKEVKALASAAGVAGATKQLPFLLILPIKSRLAYAEVELLLHARSHKTQKDLAAVGTPHMAQFIPLGNKQIGFFTVYDGSFDQYIDDFTKHMGPVFDLVFKFTQDPPPSPCRKHVQEFIDFGNKINLAPIGFYEAYPGLSVQDIHALIADSKAPAVQPGRPAAKASPDAGLRA